MPTATRSTAWLTRFMPEPRYALDDLDEAPLAQRRLDRPKEAGQLAVAILRHLADVDEHVAIALDALACDPLDCPSDAQARVIDLVIVLRLHIEDHHGRAAQRQSDSTVARLADRHRDWIYEQLGIPAAVA
jgi:hypothetical protein